MSDPRHPVLLGLALATLCAALGIWTHAAKGDDSSPAVVVVGGAGHAAGDGALVGLSHPSPAGVVLENFDARWPLKDPSRAPGSPRAPLAHVSGLAPAADAVPARDHVLVAILALATIFTLAAAAIASRIQPHREQEHG